MTLDRFKVFAAVARHRNATRASKELHVSQPAVTKQLKALERDFNTSLYKRSGLGIELTEAGQTFLKKVKKILRGYDSLVQTTRASRSSAKVETLTVGGSYSPSASLLPSLLARFEKRHPEAELSLRTDSREVVERLVLDGEVDLAVLTNPASNRQLAMESYRTEPLAAFVHRHHPLAKKRRLSWEQVGRFGFVIRKRPGGKGATVQYLQDLRKQGLRPRVVMRCDTPEGVKEAVRSKLGVGLLFRDVVENNIKRGEFKAIKLPGKTREGKSFIVYHKTRPLSPLAQDFLKLLQTRRSKF